MAVKVANLGGRSRFPRPGVWWQGYFLDPEGNTFGIFHPDRKAK